MKYPFRLSFTNILKVKKKEREIKYVIPYTLTIDLLRCSNGASLFISKISN